MKEPDTSDIPEATEEFFQKAKPMTHCLQCGVPIIRRNATAKFCNSHCSARYHSLRQSEKLRRGK